MLFNSIYFSYYFLHRFCVTSLIYFVQKPLYQARTKTKCFQGQYVMAAEPLLGKSLPNEFGTRILTLEALKGDWGGGGGGIKVTTPLDNLASNFCCLTEYQKLWYNCCVLVITYFDARNLLNTDNYTVDSNFFVDFNR